MKTPYRFLQAIALLGCLFATINTALAQKTWTNAQTDFSWSTATNWTPSGSPGTSDRVVFDYNDTTPPPGFPGVVDNIVDAGFTHRIPSLWYKNFFIPGLEFDNYHTTSVPNSLVISDTGTNNLAYVDDSTIPSTVYVGSGHDDGPTAVVYASIVGNALTVSNTSANLTVKQFSLTDASDTIVDRATLDLSGLNVFNCTVSNILVGYDLSTNVVRPRGTLILAKTNFIIANSISMGDVSNNGSGTPSYLHLGQSNLIQADIMNLGLRKMRTFMDFQPFLSLPATVKFRDKAGTGRQTWTIADENGANTSSPSVTTVDFTGGIVDAQIDQLILGRGENNIKTGDGTGTLIFGAGSMNVNAMQMGIQIWTNSASSGHGYLFLNNNGYGPPASMTVNSNITTAVIQTGNLDVLTDWSVTAGNITTADFILNGGKLSVGGDITKGDGMSSMYLANGAIVNMAADATPGNITVGTIVYRDTSTITNFARYSASNVFLDYLTAATNVTIGPGQTLNPIDAGKMGTITFALTNDPGGLYADLVLRGTTEIDVNKNGTNLTSDKVAIAGILDMGGTLKVIAHGDPLAAGDSFNYAFAYVVSNNWAAYDWPPLPPGLVWEDDLFVDATIKVKAVARPTITATYTSTTATLSWPLSFTTYTLRGQTNAPGVGLTTNWFPVPGVVGNSVTVPIDKTKGSSFYQLKSP